MARDLQRAAQWLETRADIRVVLLRGAGKAFCAGGDITLFEGDVNAVRGKLLDLFTPLNDFIAHVARMDKLWLAQIHGVAAGAGLSLVLACDLAIADAETRFMTAYLKLGATPDAGMTHGLNRLLGPRRALDQMCIRDRWSDRSITMPMSCSTISTVTPHSARASRMKRAMSSVSSRFMPATGSSSISTLGCIASARASSTRLRSPYDSAATGA